MREWAAVLQQTIQIHWRQWHAFTPVFR
jgi:hypothetical protein